jgi:UPF0755 protein
MKKTLGLLAALLLLGFLAAGWFGSRAWTSLFEPYQGYPGEGIQLEVERGRQAREILDSLEGQGIIASAFWTRLYLTRQLGDPSLKAGEYEFVGPQKATAVLDKLIRGEVVTHDVTIVEGLDIAETAAHLAAEGFGDEETFLRLMRDSAAIADLDPMASDLEGYLLPETYSFARGTGEATIVGTMIATFRQRLEDQVEPLLDPESSLSLRQLVTLASIVEKETGAESERQTVAGVYSNRLRRGMGLFADPTVIYALKLAGTWDGNIRREDLKIDSPYNTYRYAGLPPGPICSPGVASLKAAAQPADVPYLYFVSRNDGSHVFSRTLSEHNRNVEIWQRQYWRERWARERAAERNQ